MLFRSPPPILFFPISFGERIYNIKIIWRGEEDVLGSTTSLLLKIYI